MNIRLFIAEVKKRRVLWDHSSRCYHNKRVLNDGWREVAKIFNIEVITAKQKWKNLRDTFRIELKKTKRYSSLEDGTDPPPLSLWAYYEDMYFLKDILRTRGSREFPELSAKSDFSETLPESIKQEAEMTFSSDPLVDENDASENKTNIYIENVTSLHSQSDDVDTTDDAKKWRIQDEREKTEDEQDDDLLFFRSLMPFVKKLDQDKKLLFRMNVQQMLYDQLYNN